MRYCPWPRGPLSVCLLPDHPLIITAVSLLRAGLNIRAVTLLDRIAQGATSLSKSLGSLYLSPHALEILIDVTLERKSYNVLPALTRELARTQSTRSLTRLQFPTSEVTAASGSLALRLSEVYAKLMDAHFQTGNHESVLELYSAATRALVPCSSIIFKRAIQSLFKRFIPSPDSDLRRASRPNSSNDLEANINPPEMTTTLPPVDLILEQLRLILNKMVADNMIPSSRLLADIFRGLGSILKLETYGVDSGDNGTIRDSSHSAPESDLPSLGTKIISPRFRLDRLILDEEAWLFVGKLVNNILAQTTSQSDYQNPGNEGRVLLQMAWADVMLSLREDIADATARGTATKFQINALSARVTALLGADQPWNYQRTFDRLANSSFLRPHHVNSYGEVGSEADPALDLPVGPTPVQWPISRTITEAQRISLLIRDRLVEGDSLAALLQFHSLASLCGAFRRLCEINDPEEAPSMLRRTPGGTASQRPPETVLAEARQELDLRVESVYVRLAGHALRTGDSSYVNDVLELAYTLPPRRNKHTFSRVWKRAMGAFISWRAEWHGSAGIGRAFKTLAQLLGIRPGPASTTIGTIDRARPKAIIAGGPSRELFDLSWLRERHTWPALGRNVFPRTRIISALIDRAEETTPLHLRPGSKPDRKIAARHLQDAQRASEEAETRRAIRWLRKNHPHYMPRPGDPLPTATEIDAEARDEVYAFYNRANGQEGAGSLGDGQRTGEVPPITILTNVFSSLEVPMTTDEARRMGYDGPTFVKEQPKDSVSSDSIQK